MFNNQELRSHPNLKLLLSTQVINLSVIITPINWVAKLGMTKIHGKPDTVFHDD